MPKDIIIDIKHLSKSFGDKKVLEVYKHFFISFIILNIVISAFKFRRVMSDIVRVAIGYKSANLK